MKKNDSGHQTLYFAVKEETNNRLAMILGVSRSFSLSATESQLSSESNALCAFRSCYCLRRLLDGKGEWKEYLI